MPTGVKQFALSNKVFTIEVFFFFPGVLGDEEITEKTIVWCTINPAEHKKCQEWAKAVETSRSFKSRLICKVASDKDQCMNLIDAQRADLVTLDPGELSVAGQYHSLVPIMAETYGTGELFCLLMANLFVCFTQAKEKGYYAVAVVNVTTATRLRTLEDLKGKKACFSGVGQLTGWVIPLATLIEKQVLEVSDCNNLVKSASHFFGNSCAPNSLIDKYNPFGDNPHQMCQICKGPKTNLCSGSDPYAEYEGAFKCLLDEGEIAFLKHSTVDEMVQNYWYTGPPRNTFKLLCPNGDLTEVDNYASCNWGFVPAHVVATTSAASTERKLQYQRFLEKSLQLFGPETSWRTDSGRDQNLEQRFQLFKSAQYNKINLLFQDHTSGLRPLQNMQVKGYLRESEKYFQMLQRCPVPPARLCVVSEAEYSKCNRMSTAFRGQMLKPDLACVRGHSHVHCMQLIQEQSADLAVLDPGDVYTAGHSTLKRDRGGEFPEIEEALFRWIRQANAMKLAINGNILKEKAILLALKMGQDNFEASNGWLEKFKARNNIAFKRLHGEAGSVDANSVATWKEVRNVKGRGTCCSKYGLIPVVAEQYNLPDPAFYVVAVARQPDKDTDLLYLKGKTSCHTGINQAAGWIIPMSFLITNDRMRAFGCNAPRAAAEFFQKSCVPGAMSREHTFGTNAGSIHNLCDLCHGSSHSFCSRDSSEPFYGNSGALRCLVEGGGQIAFVRHTTISENTAGRNQAWWSRPLMPADFELLCRDGTRRLYNESKQCNLGKVPSNAIVTSPSKPEAVIEAYIELFLYAQQYYGSKYSERFTFKMFVSPNDYQDLIFQDATQQLRKIEPERRDYKTYLGFDFLQSVRVVDCTAGAGTISLSATFITLFLSFLVLGHLGV
ncbi:MFI2 [Cordylochernes scorpioides]|uniref:MFI2 n=1 Tax=Cordylochernes scorpioides TaxID=51811 RepID=A0ABY6KHJ0_9ARAC|nr:MFI2 [Cordylochernes scorpioides]